MPETVQPSPVPSDLSGAAPEHPKMMPRGFDKHYLPGPGRVIVAVWLVVLLNYALGPNDYEALSFNTLLYLSAVFVIFNLGILWGSKWWLRTTRRLDLPPPQINTSAWRVLTKYGSWISAIGGMVSFFFNIRAGKTIGLALYNTEIVRKQVVEDLGPISVLSNAFGFLSFSWLVATLLLCRFDGGLRKHFLALTGALIGVGFLLLTYFVNVNRTAFLALLLFGIAFVGFVEKGSWRRAIRSLGRTGLIFATIGAIICVTYILFIAVARADRGENERFVATYMQLRYRLPPIEALDYDTACGVYKLQWYGSHQIRNLDQVVRNGNLPLFDFDGRLTFIWPLGQLLRFKVDISKLNADAMDDWSALLIRSGNFDWQWATALLTFCFDFGLLGSLFIVGFIGWLVGWAYWSFYYNGSVLSAIIGFWWSALAMLLLVNYPIDNFFQTNLFGLLAIRSYLWLVGRKNI